MGKAAFTPTDEQIAIINQARTEADLKVIALAGTGKTTTMELASRAMPGRKGLYLAFNKSVQLEADARFPKTVTAKTAHSLAYGKVGRKFRDRLNGPRVPAWQLAERFAVEGFSMGEDHQIPPRAIAATAAGTVRRFTHSADTEISKRHVLRLDGLTPAAQTALGDHILPYAEAMWADLQDPGGDKAAFTHDCQPPGTLVRRIKKGSSQHGPTLFEDVPIEQINDGDKVVSYDMKKHRGYVRRAGRQVNAVGSRPYNGDLITVTTANGRQSSYTTEHRCIVRLDTDLADGNYVVYLARKGNDFRIGRTTWRTKSQNNMLGIRRRAESQRADAIWILSVHATDADAALEEALVAHRWRIPTWQFRASNETMPLDLFWSKVGNNIADARACLSAHGLDIRFPFWEKGDGWESTRRPVVMRAQNLLNGMQVLEIDEIVPVDDKGALLAHHGSGGWAPITVTRSPYEGMVYNLDVDTDHTYVADGIATHNCYLKLWALTDPVLPYDYIVMDEAQDANPVLLDILSKQNQSQRILVGDPNQAIYGWRGAHNALGSWKAQSTLNLTESFRFGPEVATEANKWLQIPELECDLRVVGRGPKAVIGPVKHADAILCRTNAGAVGEALDLIDRPRERVAIVGGGKAIKDMALAAIELQTGKATSHPELAAFENWEAVREYVRTEDGAEDLAVFVRLVDKHGPDVLIDGVDALVDEQRGRPTTTISTAHKAKGREWNSVRVGSDFFEPGLDEYGKLQRLDKSEAMLCYVTVTRAKRHLDNDSLAWVDYYLAGNASPEQQRRWIERQAAKGVDDDGPAPGSLAAVKQFVREQRAEEREYTNG